MSVTLAPGRWKQEGQKLKGQIQQFCYRECEGCMRPWPKKQKQPDSDGTCF